MVVAGGAVEAAEAEVLAAVEVEVLAEDVEGAVCGFRVHGRRKDRQDLARGQSHARHARRNAHPEEESPLNGQRIVQQTNLIARQINPARVLAKNPAKNPGIVRETALAQNPETNLAIALATNLAIALATDLVIALATGPAMGRALVKDLPADFTVAKKQ